MTVRKPIRGTCMTCGSNDLSIAYDPVPRGSCMNCGSRDISIVPLAQFQSEFKQYKENVTK